RTRQACVHDPAPIAGLSLLNVEPQRLPVSVYHHVQVTFAETRAAQMKCKAVRIMSHIHLVARAMPLDILSPKSAASDRATRLAQGDHPLEKAEQVAVLLKPIPVDPGHLVILVVRIVVAVLSVEELVAGTEHRGTVGQHQQTTKVFHLPTAQRQDVFQQAVVALPTAVPAQVVVCAVLVAVSIYLIVLVVISNQIVKAKPIMGGNKVNALI